MTHTVEAVYEHGVLRPLTPVNLTDSQRVKLIISDPYENSQRDIGAVERALAEIGSLAAAPSIEEVRAALATIPGCLSDDVVADRGDY